MNANIFNQIPVYLFWKNLKSEFLGCNDYFAKVAGLNGSEEIIGKTDFDLAWGNTHGALYQQGDREVFDGVAKLGIVETQRQSDGCMVNIITNKAPLYDENKQLMGLIGSFILHTTLAQPSPTIQQNTSHGLTKQQARCLYYLVQGMTTKQIAKQLGISPKTVEYHFCAVKAKLHCSTRLELFTRALELGFVNYQFSFIS